MTSRRGFLVGAVGVLAMPAIVKAVSLMKIVSPKPKLIRLEDAVDHAWSYARFNGDIFFMGDNGFYRIDYYTKMLSRVDAS